ncbi:hypothetical protein FB451DRAFT_1257811 [Mycena latifolia]|nr:hypothetical protein FB451DRAFT_1257811 [Mycena latifolia]
MLRLPPFPRLLPLLIFSSLRRWPIPALRSYSFGLQGSTSRKGRLIPEASAPPWVQSDPNVWKDLIPLYDNSWGFSYDYPEPGEEVDGVAVLRRIFPFPSFMSSNHLLTFIESTRNASSGNVPVFP